MDEKQPNTRIQPTRRFAPQPTGVQGEVGFCLGSGFSSTARRAADADVRPLQVWFL
jgi:hypothetical protein